MNDCGFFISLVWRNVPLRHDDGFALQRWSDFINRASSKYKTPDEPSVHRAF
jgi:hypothetical protein